MGLAKAVENELSTYPLTVHLDEIEMTRLEQEGRELFKDYSPKARRRMAKEGKAMPDGSFPIATCADAENAIRSIGRAPEEKRNRVRAHIRKRVRAMGCTGQIFDSWK